MSLALHVAAARADQVLLPIGHAGEIHDVAFSGDGRWLASASGDGSAGVWFVPARRMVASVASADGAEPTAVGLSRDGQLLAASYPDGTVRVVAWASGAVVGAARVESRRLQRLRVDGDELSGVGPGVRCRWHLPDLAVATQRCELGDERPGDGGDALRGEQAATLRYVEGERYEIAIFEGLRTSPRWLFGDARSGTSLALGPGLLAAGDERGLRLARLVDGGGERRFAAAGPGRQLALAVASSGGWAVGVRGGDGVEGALLDRWSLTDGRVTSRHLSDGDLRWSRRAWLSPDDRTLVVATVERLVFVEVGGAAVLPALERPQVRAAALDPAGERLLVWRTGTSETDVRIWSLVDGDEPAALVPLSLPSSLACVAFSAGGDLVLAGGFRQARALDVRTGGEVARLEVSETVVRIASAGDLVALGGGKGTVHLWRPRGGDGGRAIHAHDEELTAIALSRDGKLLATADRTHVRVWRTSDGERTVEVTPAKGGIRALAFDGAGARLLVATSRADRAARPLEVFRSGDGVSLGALPGAPGGLLQLAVSDGDQLFTAGLDHGLRRLDPAARGDTAPSLLTFGAAVRALASDRRGQLLAVTTVDGVVHLVRDGIERARLSQTAAGGWLVVGPAGDPRHDGARGTIAEALYLGGASASPVPLAGSPSRPIARLLPSLLTGAAPRAEVARGPALVPQGTSHGAALLAMSRDGRVLVTAGGINDGTVLSLWDLVTGKLLRSQRLPARALDVSPDGQLVAMYGGERVQLRDAATFGVRREIDGIGAVAFHPDGRRLAVERYGAVALVDVAGGATLAEIAVGALGARALGFSGDGRLLATFGADGEVRWFDVATGTRRHSGAGHPPADPMNASVVRVSPDAAHVASSDGFTVRLFDAARGVRRHELSVRGDGDDATQRRVVEDLAFTPDGKRLAGAVAFGPVIVWDVATGRVVQRLERATSAKRLAFSPEGGTLLAACGLGLVRFDLASGEPLQTLGRPLLLGDVAVSPTATSLLVDSGQVRMWEARSPTRLREVEGGGAWSAGGEAWLAWSGDGQVVAAGTTHDLVVRDATSGRVRWQKKTGPSRRVALDREGRSVAFVTLRGFRQQSVEVWDVARGERRLEHRVDGADVTALAFSPRGDALALAVDDKKRGVTLLDGRGAPRWVAPVTGVRGARAIAFSPDGRLLAVADGTNRPVLLDAATGAARGALVGHPSQIGTLAWSPDGAQLLTGGTDTRLVVWDTGTLRPTEVVTGHDAPLRQLAFTGGGRLLVSRSDDGAVRLWRWQARPQLLVTLLFFGEELLIADAEGHYYATRGALEAVAFRVGDHAFPVEQFDALLNRPDRIARALGAAPELVNALERAHQRRLRRLGVDEASLAPDFSLPSVELLGAVPAIAREEALQLRVRARDPAQPLASLHVFVNDVPLLGSAGRSLRGRRDAVEEVTVPLSHGANKIQVVVRNERGSESLRETRLVQRIGPAPPRRLFVITVGVSRFREAGRDLTFAAKDARDVAAHFQGVAAAAGFATVEARTLVDDQVTLERLPELRRLLAGSRPDDLVVLFLAGHGLLDGNLDFFFAAHDTDFAHPAARGLPFDALEGLLDGIPARQKLLLVDACHSGEVDREAPLTAAEVPAGVVVRGVLVTESASGMPAATGPRAPMRDLVSELFADLRRGSGAVVIAAAAAAEYALESATWNNGVFTSAILEALGRARADRDGDHRVAVSELRGYVVDRVRQLTRGRQTPAARRENLANDFVVP